MVSTAKPKPLTNIQSASLDAAVRRDGWLSESTTTIVEHCRAQHAQWFELAEGLNRLCMRLLWSLAPKRSNNQQLLVTLLFGRCLSAYQAAIVLAERGMVLEARYVLRALLEATFALAANAKDKSFPDDYIHDDHHRLVKMINACLRLPLAMKAFHKLDEEEMRTTKKQAKAAIKAKQSKPLKVADVADRGGMASHHDTIYRLLSSSAHAAMRDLDYHIIETADKQIDRFGWGPQIAKSDDPLMQACDSLLIAAAHVLTVFDRPELENQHAALHRRFENLLNH